MGRMLPRDDSSKFIDGRKRNMIGPEQVESAR
jgi:hypothetical protein